MSYCSFIGKSKFLLVAAILSLGTLACSSTGRFGKAKSQAFDKVGLETDRATVLSAGPRRIYRRQCAGKRQSARPSEFEFIGLNALVLPGKWRWPEREYR